MSQFLGTHQNRLDAKGRVSIPAAFRDTLRGLQREGEHQLVLRPSHQNASIEGWPGVTFSGFDERVEGFDTYAEEQDDLLLTMFATAFPVESDREGRIILPDNFIAHANLNDSVSFIGLGRRFEIWEPEAGKALLAGAARRAREKGLTVPGLARPTARQPVDKQPGAKQPGAQEPVA